MHLNINKDSGKKKKKIVKKEATFVKISTNDKKWKQKISSDPAMIEKWALKSGLSYLFQ